MKSFRVVARYAVPSLWASCRLRSPAHLWSHAIILGGLLLAGGLALCPSLRGQPDNDQFANRIRLEGTVMAFEGYGLGAGIEPDEPNHSAPPERTTASAWWSWSAPGDGSLVLRCQDVGGPFLSAIACYEGESLANLHLLGRLQPWISSRMVAKVSAGRTYALAAYGTDDRGFGWFRCQLEYVPGTRNDAFVERLPLTGRLAEMAGSTFGATRETGEPAHGAVPGARSTWWSWRAPAKGLASINRRGSWEQSLYLAVYRGSTLPSLQRIALSGESWLPVFECEAGEEYAIAVVGVSPEDQTAYTYDLVLSELGWLVTTQVN